MIRYKIFNLLEEYQTNTYLFYDDKSMEAIIFDPADKSKKLSKFIEIEKLNPKMIINTHGHFDHIGGNGYFKELYDIPIAIHPKDEKMLTDAKLNLSVFTENAIISPKADLFINENTNDIYLGNNLLQIIHTPGHTQGSISVLIDKFLVSGDTLFYESIGRTDLPNGNYEQIISSIKDKLFILPDETIVLPGHGNKTTIENEKVGNPFVGLLAR